MKGRIDADGWLHILRGNKFGPQACPFDPSGKTVATPCGCWCPLFGEPVLNDDGGGSLVICQNRLLVFEQFTDERTAGNE